VAYRCLEQIAVYVAYRCLRGVSLGPQACYSIMLLMILQILRRDTAHERVSGVAVGEKRADREQDLGYGERRGPVVL